jgi:hypothetical protein
MIELQTLYDRFRHKNSHTFREFMKKAKVKIGKREISLKEYSEKKEISLEHLKTLFEYIQQRNDYLTRFYNTSLKLPDSLCIEEPPMKTRKMNNNEQVKYKNVIRNLFFLEILKKTKSGIENHPTFLDVLDDFYTRDIIDYKILTPSALHYMNNGRLGSVFSSFYFRASIMNPYLVFSLNQTVFRATRIFTPTLGWGSYFYGFAESGIRRYVGTDVISTVCQRVGRFAAKNYPQISTEILCSPSEELADNRSFLSKNRGAFDLVFFSPPYYRLELYPGKEQSTTNYPSYESWLENYWRKTIQLCYHVLEKKGKLCYILSGYGSETIGETYDLLGDMNRITREYFRLVEIQPMYNKNVHVTSHRETAEKIMIFVKE